MKHLIRLSLLFVLLLAVTRPVSAVVFVHLSDTHINVTGKGRFSQESIPTLRRAVAAIRIIKPAFVIVTGDITEYGDEASMAAYWAEIEKVGVPVHTVQGNHDKPRKPERFNRVVGATHPVFDIEGCRFIGLNLDLADEALALLKEQLADAKAKGIRSVFTFAHYPLLAPDNAAFNLSPGCASLQGERALRYLALAQEGGIVAHFCGHLHSSYDVADPYTGILSLPVPGCVDHKGAFRVCSVTDGVLSWSVFDGSTWPLAILESVPPHVRSGTAFLEGKVSLQLLAFGPEPVLEATLGGVGRDVLPPVVCTTAGRAFEGTLDCTQLKSNFYNLRAHLVDAAGNASDRTWRVLVKGGK
ncbi:MAG: metallophosphoesterase [Lentisphaeria bacterium]|nr:metallophosphoesterase [Lentisphaeria bacterium]